MASARMSGASFRRFDAFPFGASHADRDGLRVPQRPPDRSQVPPELTSVEKWDAVSAGAPTSHVSGRDLLRWRATTVIELNHPFRTSSVLFLFLLPVPLAPLSVIAH